MNIKVFSSSDLGFFVISTIVYGKQDAVLFDAQLLQGEAEKVVKIIKDLNKELKAIFITHAHSDHFFGLKTFQKAFPDVKIYAPTALTTAIEQTGGQQIMAMKQLYKGSGLIPDTFVTPESYDDLNYTLEGENIEIIPNLTGDIAPSAAYYIPSIKVMIAGDLVYNNVHAWTLDTNNEQRNHWIASLQRLKAYQPKIVVGGHKDMTQPDSPDSLDFMIDYLTKFNQAIDTLATAEEVIEHMKQEFPAAKKTGMLRIGAKKNKGEHFSFQEFFEN